MRNTDAYLELEPAANLSLRERLAVVGRYWFGATARKAVVALADQVIVSGGSFFTTVLIGRLCGPRDLGVYSLAFAIVVMLYTIQQSLVTVPYTIYVHRLQGESRQGYTGGCWPIAESFRSLRRLLWLARQRSPCWASVRRR